MLLEDEWVADSGEPALRRPRPATGAAAMSAHSYNGRSGCNTSTGDDARHAIQSGVEINRRHEHALGRVANRGEEDVEPVAAPQQRDAATDPVGVGGVPERVGTGVEARRDPDPGSARAARAGRPHRRTGRARRRAGNSVLVIAGRSSK